MERVGKFGILRTFGNRNWARRSAGIPNWGHSDLGAQSGRKNQPACVDIGLSVDIVYLTHLVSDIAVFVLKMDVKLQPTKSSNTLEDVVGLQIHFQQPLNAH